MQAREYHPEEHHLDHRLDSKSLLVLLLKCWWCKQDHPRKRQFEDFLVKHDPSSHSTGKTRDVA